MTSAIDRGWLDTFIARNRSHAGLLIALVVLFAILSVAAPNFLSGSNLLNILAQSAFVGIIACGMTLVIVAGEIDISVGSAVALASALLGVLYVNLGVPLWLACLIVLLEAAAVGAAAGYIRARYNIPSFIVTLALFSILKGIALMITNAFPIPIENEAFAWLGQGRILGVPVPALVMIAAFVFFWWVSTRTVFGRAVYAVGGNAKAAEMSGIPVFSVRVTVFAITGFLAAVAAILLSARLGSGNPNVGLGYEFDVIAAVIIGGTSLYGGRGSLVGTFMGVLFVGMLGNGMVLLGISPFAQNVVRGVVVLAAVLLSMRHQRVGRKRTQKTRGMDPADEGVTHVA